MPKQSNMRQKKKSTKKSLSLFCVSHLLLEMGRGGVTKDKKEYFYNDKRVNSHTKKKIMAKK